MKYFRFRPVFILSVLLGFQLGLLVFAVAGEKSTSPKGADAILINALSTYGKLEKFPVIFFHDKHTTALKSSKLSCKLCHLKEGDSFYPKFKRVEDAGRTELMNLYHDGCISCHGEMRLKKEQTGPVDCDACHLKPKTYKILRQPMGFDPSLHFRHSKALEKKCESCHHEYDESRKKLVYVKDQEGTCRYCHKDKTIENRISMAQASHLACINCHINSSSKPEATPPISCHGCHDADERKKIKKVFPVPRMEQRQPDQIIVSAEAADGDKKVKFNPVGGVPFNHKAHESKDISCRICHHESWQPCSSCHTPGGSPGSLSKKTNSLSFNKTPSLENTMHSGNATGSCIGCHNEQKLAMTCAGCHESITVSKPVSDQTCKKCHVVPNKTDTFPLNREKRESLALNFVKTTNTKQLKTSPQKIPETVTIGGLSDKYQAVNLPHGKIINTLKNGMKDNRLSAYFHNDSSICAGCHHNSPASEKPPACASCHTKRWDASKPDRPGILGAYHQQCIGCHNAMEIMQEADCAACHKSK